MALIKADRVKETTTSTGTSNIALAGAATGYRAFSSVCAVGDTCYYAIAHQTTGEWEVGLATYSAANTLQRTAVHASSNSNTIVTFSAGTKDVFLSVTKSWLDTFVTTTGGNLNYLTKTTGSNTIGNSQIYDDGTYVGIGTTSPGAQLQVTTAAAATKGLIVKGASGQSSRYIELQDSTGTVIAGVNSAGMGEFNEVYSGVNGKVQGFNGVELQAWNAGAMRSAAYVYKDLNMQIGGTITPNVNIGSNQLLVVNSSPSWAALRIKGASAQSANLLELQNSSGTNLSYVSSVGTYSHLSSGSVDAFRAIRSSDNGNMVSIGYSSGSSEGYFTCATTFSLNNGGYGLRIGGWSGWTDATNAEVIWVKGTSSLIFGYNAAATLNRTLFSTSYFQITASSSSVPVPTSRFEVYGDARIESQAATTKALVVKGASGQSANLQEWQNNSGTALASFDANGTMTSYGAHIYNQSASVPTLRVRSGNPSTTNIQEWQNYYGTVLSRVDANGKIVAPEVSTSNLNTYQWFAGTSYVFSRIFLKNGNLPSVVGNYIELFECTRARSMPIRIAINANGPHQGKVYDFVFGNGAYGGSSGIIPPLYSAGESSSDDFELEVYHVDAYLSRFRLRRTAGTSNRAFQAYINVQVGNTGTSFTSLSGTGTSTVGSGELPGYGIYTHYIKPVHASTYTGNGRDLTLVGASGQGTGNGGNILLQAGAFSTSGSNGKVIVRGLASNTANLQEWQNNAGAVLSYVAANGVPAAYGGGQIATNTAFGVSALNANTTGFYCNAFGSSALAANTTGTNNIAIGTDALRNCTTSAYNTGIGYRALYSITTGNGSNVAVGDQSLAATTTGIDNTSVGVYSLLNNTTGSGNVAVGKYAGRWLNDRSSGLTAPTNSIYIGFESKGYSASETNAIVIGYWALGKGSNTTVIGNSSTVSTDVFGTLTTTLGTATQKGIVVKAASGQSANLQEWQNNAGTALAYVNSSGTIGIPYADGKRILLEQGLAFVQGVGGSAIISGGNGGVASNAFIPIMAGTPSTATYATATSIASFQNGTAGGLVGTGLNIGSYSKYGHINRSGRSGFQGISIEDASPTVEFSMRGGTQGWLTWYDYANSRNNLRIIGDTSNNFTFQAWNGSSVATAAVINSNGVQTPGSIQITSNTPSAFTADQNDLALTASGFQRLSGTAARNITGIAPPSGASHVDGRMMRIYNVGSYNLTFKHNSTSSTAANRFFNVQAIDIIVGPNDYAELIYDGTNNGSGAAGWRVA